MSDPTPDSPVAAETEPAPSSTSAAPTEKVQDSKQPKGLYWLFGAEAWERFSYYGMRAILVLYLVNQLQFDRKDALALYGVYTGLVYLTPLLGGYLADRFLGARKAVIIGGCTMAIGELCLAVPELLYPALALLILGNGFFKPNISTIVGGLYSEGDPRRDGGFTIFYMGINLGAFFSPLICGTLGESYGWGWGFAAAGIGMILGQFIFNFGQRHFGLAGFPPDIENPTAETHLRVKDYIDIVLYMLGIVGIVAISYFSWQHSWLLNGLMNPQGLLNSPLPLAVALFVLITVGIGFNGRKSEAEKAEEAKHHTASDERMVLGFTIEEWQRIAVIIILAFFVTFFWMGFEQAGGTLTLFADNQTERNIHFLNKLFEIPASWFQSINPFVIVTLAPVFSVMWYKLDNSRFAISTPMKMAIGMIILGLGFIVMFFGASLAVDGNKVGPQWLFFVFFLHTLGELCLSPVGLSMVTKLAPQRLMSIMMGFWFLSSAVANYSAGVLEHLLSLYHINIWAFLISSSIGAGIVLICLTPLLKKWMHGRA